MRLKDRLDAGAAAAAGFAQQQRQRRQLPHRGRPAGKAGGAERGHLLAVERQRQLVRAARGAVHDGKIDLVVAETALDGLRVVDKDARLQPGHVGPQAGEQRGQHGLADRDVDADQTARRAAAVAQHGRGLVAGTEDRAGVLEQGLARLREVDAAVHAVEQPHPVIALQLADGDADGGLRHAELRGGAADAAAAADRREDLQMANGHAVTSSINDYLYIL